MFCLLQSFAKGLLDVADNLGRAAAAVPEEFRKSDGPEDPSGAAKLLISLLLGVEMTEKQLIQVSCFHPAFSLQVVWNLICGILTLLRCRPGCLSQQCAVHVRLSAHLSGSFSM